MQTCGAFGCVPRPDLDPGLCEGLVALAHRHAAGTVHLKLRQDATSGAGYTDNQWIDSCGIQAYEMLRPSKRRRVGPVQYPTAAGADWDVRPAEFDAQYYSQAPVA